MRALLLAALAIGCSAEPRAVLEDPPSRESPANCGDKLCEPNELRYMCPKDCLRAAMTLTGGDILSCTDTRSPREVASVTELGLELAESVARLEEGLHWVARFSRALRQPYARLVGSELLWLENLPYSFDPATATYLCTDPLWDGRTTVTATFGRDYTTFKAGTPIPHDLFEPASYLVGGRVVSASGPYSTVDQVAYDSTGPLVELLGQGPKPLNPIGINYLDTSREFEAQVFEYRLVRERSNGDVNTMLAVKGRIKPNEPPTLELDTATGRNAKLGQTATISAFKVTVGETACNTVGYPCRFSGKATITIADGPLPHSVEVSFDHDRISILCPQR